MNALFQRGLLLWNRARKSLKRSKTAQKFLSENSCVRYFFCAILRSGKQVKHDMNDHFPELGRCVSVLDRLMKMYYDHELADFEIGWGQQFYVEYIYDHPGASAQEMVEYIRVDKATLTKIIKKLIRIGYVKVVSDEKDKRVRHLYLTGKAVPAVKRIKEIHRDFYTTICSGISAQDIHLTEQALAHMVENINQKVWHRMEE